MLVVQADAYDTSRLATVVAAVITSTTASAAMPRNTFLPRTASGLPRDSVVDVTALVTLDKDDLDDRAGVLPIALMQSVDSGLRRVLAI